MGQGCTSLHLSPFSSWSPTPSVCAHIGELPAFVTEELGEAFTYSGLRALEWSTVISGFSLLGVQNLKTPLRSSHIQVFVRMPKPSRQLCQLLGPWQRLGLNTVLIATNSLSRGTAAHGFSRFNSQQASFNSHVP